MKIKRTTGSFGHERLTIRTFTHSQDGHAFLNKQSDNIWTVYDGPLASGHRLAACGTVGARAAVERVGMLARSTFGASSPTIVSSSGANGCDSRFRLSGDDRRSS